VAAKRSLEVECTCWDQTWGAIRKKGGGKLLGVWICGIGEGVAEGDPEVEDAEAGDQAADSSQGDEVGESRR